MSTAASDPAAELDAAAAGRFAELALACVHQEYPNKIAHVLQGDADVKPPRELTPSFYGCFDWHSAVHGHWLLARGARLHPEAAWAADARAALARSLTPERVEQVMAFLQATPENVRLLAERIEHAAGIGVEADPGLDEAGTPTRQGLEMAADPPPSPPAGYHSDRVLLTREVAETSDAPFCRQCGTQMVRAGSCYACRDCGSTSGCS